MYCGQYLYTRIYDSLANHAGLHLLQWRQYFYITSDHSTWTRYTLIEKNIMGHYMCMQDNIYGCSFTHHVRPHFEELREQPFGEFLVSLQYTITCILKRESGRGALNYK